VAVQNYIDNTGVQVADVVIAFQQMEKKSLADVKVLATGKNFDYLCWDLMRRPRNFLKKTRCARGNCAGDVEGD